MCVFTPCLFHFISFHFIFISFHFAFIFFSCHFISCHVHFSFISFLFILSFHFTHFMSMAFRLPIFIHFHCDFHHDVHVQFVFFHFILCNVLIFMSLHGVINQSTNQSVNQPINQPTLQSLTPSNIDGSPKLFPTHCKMSARSIFMLFSLIIQYPLVN